MIKTSVCVSYLLNNWVAVQQVLLLGWAQVICLCRKRDIAGGQIFVGTGPEFHLALLHTTSHPPDGHVWKSLWERV